MPVVGLGLVVFEQAQSKVPMTPNPDTNTPLGPDDFDAQDAELDALREHDEEIPQWEFCEGFLAALVCTRRAVAPEEYWPVLLGEGFQPVAHMEFVWRWRRRWDEIAAALDAPVETLDDERTYQPEALDTRGAVLALPEAERGETDIADAARLCAGLGAGLHVCRGNLARRLAAAARPRSGADAGQRARAPSSC